MSERPTGETQTKKPEPMPGLVLPERSTGSRWMKVAIIFAIVAALGWGFAFGYIYLQYKSSQTPTETTAPPTPETNNPEAGPSITEPVETQSALAAYLPYLEIYDLKIVYEDPLSGTLESQLMEGDFTEPRLAGKIKNNGNKTLSLVAVTFYFKDLNGQHIFEKRADVVRKASEIDVLGMKVGENKGPLRPGYIQDFRVDINSIPSEWNQEVPDDYAVTAIRFGE